MTASSPPVRPAANSGAGEIPGAHRTNQHRGRALGRTHPLPVRPGRRLRRLPGPGHADRPVGLAGRRPLLRAQRLRHGAQLPDAVGSRFELRATAGFLRAPIGADLAAVGGAQQPVSSRGSWSPATTRAAPRSSSAPGDRAVRPGRAVGPRPDVAPRLQPGCEPDRTGLVAERGVPRLPELPGPRAGLLAAASTPARRPRRPRRRGDDADGAAGLPLRTGRLQPALARPHRRGVRQRRPGLPVRAPGPRERGRAPGRARS